MQTDIVPFVLKGQQAASPPALPNQITELFKKNAKNNFATNTLISLPFLQIRFFQ